MAGGIQASGVGGGRGGRRPRLMAEINMTPFVDVMLVLLIVFMVAAPLLTVAVPVDLPDSDATAITEEVEPIAVTIQADGTIYLQETVIERDALIPRLAAIATTGYEHRIYVRADEGLSYGQVMDVTGAIEGAGFKRLALVTQ